MAQDSTTGDDRTGRPPVRRALPESALAGLRDAFAGEVATRLPRLQALRDDDRAADPAVVAQALRDAHALGSSAVVVGENEASRCARALEAELAAHDGTAALPASAHAHVQVLTVLLSPWIAA